MISDHLTALRPETDHCPRPSPHSTANRVARACWNITYTLCFRPTPRILHGWRRVLLRAFGAKIGRGAVVHPTVAIWAPWNLEMDDHSCLGPRVDCYNAAPIRLGKHSVVSQHSILCTATHDYTSLRLPLITRAITIGAHAWVCADVYVGPGVNVGDGAVVGARSSVYKDVPPWTVVGGNPARILKARIVSGQ